MFFQPESSRNGLFFDLFGVEGLKFSVGDEGAASENHDLECASGYSSQGLNNFENRVNIGERIICLCIECCISMRYYAND